MSMASQPKMRAVLLGLCILVTLLCSLPNERVLWAGAGSELQKIENSGSMLSRRESAQWLESEQEEFLSVDISWEQRLLRDAGRFPCLSLVSDSLSVSWSESPFRNSSISYWVFKYPSQHSASSDLVYWDSIVLPSLRDSFCFKLV
jgi:hypothetical protein